MVVYLNCEYLNSKHFTYIFIIKKKSIFTFQSSLPKHSVCLKIRPIIFNRLLSVHFISLYKFASTNSVVKIRLEIQFCTSGNCMKSSRSPTRDHHLLLVGLTIDIIYIYGPHQQVPLAAVDKANITV